MKGKYTTSVVVDAIQSTKPLTSEFQIDEVDASMKVEQMLDNIFYTPLGLTVHRKVIGSGQQFHDNYLIYDYTLTNSGIVDNIGTTRSPQTLNGVMMYFMSRYGITRDAGDVISTTIMYGINTVVDTRGDTSNPGPAGYFSTNTDRNDLRVSFAWGGDYENFGYSSVGNTIGGPIISPSAVSGDSHLAGDTVGRLSAYQFVGWATLHVDKSTHDTVDDKKQPSTTSFEASDGDYTYSPSLDQYSDPAMQIHMNTMMKRGHYLPRHADAVGSLTAKPNTVLTRPGDKTSGGASFAVGYGPFTIAPSESLHIVCAEVAAGLTQDAAIKIGHAYKLSGYGDGVLINYNGVSKTKNQWVLSGKDSLFQSVDRAIANYSSGYNIPQPPAPPSTFTVQSAPGQIHMEWMALSDPLRAGWQIWRAIGDYDSTYYKIYEGPADTKEYNDVTATKDAAYYYYLVAVGRASDNTGIGATPLGPLVSSRYYTQTYLPAYRRVAASPTLIQSAVRIVPNPYNFAANKALLWSGSGQNEKVVFKNIPAYCTIKIYSELGELINTINHNRGDGSEDYYLTTSYGQKLVTGVYIAVIETPQGERGMYKFVVIR